MVNEKDKWPKIVPESLMPVKAVKGQPVPADIPPPWDDGTEEVKALAPIIEEARAIGFSMKEIIDVAQSEFGKKPDALSDEEIDRFQVALGV